MSSVLKVGFNQTLEEIETFLKKKEWENSNLIFPSLKITCKIIERYMLIIGSNTC